MVNDRRILRTKTPFTFSSSGNTFLQKHELHCNAPNTTKAHAYMYICSNTKYHHTLLPTLPHPRPTPQQKKKNTRARQQKRSESGLKRPKYFCCLERPPTAQKPLPGAPTLINIIQKSIHPLARLTAQFQAIYSELVHQQLQTKDHNKHKRYLEKN